MDEIQLVRDLSILELVVSSITEVTNSHAICPFHEDSNPSMHLFVAQSGRARYHCFGCEADGDVITFVRRAFRLSHMRAVVHIGSLIGQPITFVPPERPSVELKAPVADVNLSRRFDRLLRLYEDLKIDYESLLQENNELRDRLDMPSFRPSNEDPRLRPLILENERLKDEIEYLRSRTRQIESLETELLEHRLGRRT